MSSHECCQSTLVLLSSDRHSISTHDWEGNNSWPHEYINGEVTYAKIVVKPKSIVDQMSIENHKTKNEHNQTNINIREHLFSIVIIIIGVLTPKQTDIKLKNMIKQLS